jgi:predicted ATPase
MGIPVGSGSTPDSIAAVFASHLQRQREVECDLNVLDRCVIDALAYVRVLNVTSPVQTKMYEELAKTMACALNFVVHLDLSKTFEVTSAGHETAGHRLAIAAELPLIIQELGLPSVTIDAAHVSALTDVTSILRKMKIFA